MAATDYFKTICSSSSPCWWREAPIPLAPEKANRTSCRASVYTVASLQQQLLPRTARRDNSSEENGLLIACNRDDGCTLRNDTYVKTKEKACDLRVKTNRPSVAPFDVIGEPFQGKRTTTRETERCKCLLPSLLVVRSILYYAVLTFPRHTPGQQRHFFLSLSRLQAAH